ncbi:MAPEG family protein [Thalassotalea sp. LPB0316]|uniref:MAPEG family protein n=1 Tax=Thalassotalea sp. LPB0316 TaxID=2769490 RepID=UPI001D03D96A|nr:MAPEG family protein [Thalassotalea sp. LPB0316]
MKLIDLTAFYGAILTLLYIALAINVIRMRFKHQVGLGDLGKIEVLKAIRIHGNFAEYIPLALLLMAFYEVNGGSEQWLHGFGIALIISRVLHAIGLSKSYKTSLPRAGGTLLLFGVLITLSVTLLIS